MICATIREGLECVFMTPKGCSYNNGVCLEIIDKCEGCNHILNLKSGNYCSAYPDPNIKWKHEKCNLATHLKEEEKQSKTKINPLKASKRSIKKK